MKVYVAILPWDYTSAEAVVFGSREEAQEFIDEHGQQQRHYSVIREQTIHVRRKKEGAQQK